MVKEKTDDSFIPCNVLLTSHMEALLETAQAPQGCLMLKTTPLLPDRSRICHLPSIACSSHAYRTSPLHVGFFFLYSHNFTPQRHILSERISYHTGTS